MPQLSIEMQYANFLAALGRTNNPLGLTEFKALVTSPQCEVCHLSIPKGKARVTLFDFRLGPIAGNCHATCGVCLKVALAAGGLSKALKHVARMKSPGRSPVFVERLSLEAFLPLVGGRRKAATLCFLRAVWTNVCDPQGVPYSGKPVDLAPLVPALLERIDYTSHQSKALFGTWDPPTSQNEVIERGYTTPDPPLKCHNGLSIPVMMVVLGLAPPESLPVAYAAELQVWRAFYEKWLAMPPLERPTFAEWKRSQAAKLDEVFSSLLPQ